MWYHYTIRVFCICSKLFGFLNWMSFEIWSAVYGVFVLISLISFRQSLLISYAFISSRQDLYFGRLARLRRLPAAFLLNEAITRPATITKTFGQPYPSYMQSFIKIRGAVLEKSDHKTMALCNFNKDCDFKNTERVKNCNSVSLRILPLSKSWSSLNGFIYFT